MERETEDKNVKVNKQTAMRRETENKNGKRN